MLITGFANSQVLTEDFEGGVFPPAGWAIFDNGNGTAQSWQNSTTSYEGLNAAFVRYENVVAGTAEDWLVSPQVTPTAGNSTLSFYQAQAFAPDWSTTYTVRVSTASQTTSTDFTIVDTQTEVDFGTTYTLKTVDLSAYVGTPIYIAFVMEQDDGDSWYLDNVVLGATPCLNPSALIVNNITATTADVAWTTGGAANAEVMVLPNGSPAPTGGNALNATADNPVNLTGLTASTSYDVYVRDICNGGSPLMISGVFDMPLTGGTPKGVELYVVEDIPDLSLFGIGSANNGGGSDGEEFTFPAVAANAGSYIYIASEAPNFQTYFGFAPDYTDGSMSINGDDAVELFYNGAVVDVFGDINVDGTGQSWEFLDGWAYRNMDELSNGGAFIDANWTYSGPNAVDPCSGTDNAGCASVFPIGTFTTSSLSVSNWVGPVTFTTACEVITAPYLQDFSSFVPSCWEEAGDGDATSGPLSLGGSDWNHTSYLNLGGANDAIKINLYSDTDQEWMLSPVFDLSSGGPFELLIEAGVTDYNATGAATMGSDDEVQVLVTTDGGTTWTDIYTWNAGNTPSVTGDNYVIDLSSYNGSSVQFAIWATDGVVDDAEDFDFHVSTFQIRTPCTPVTGTDVQHICDAASYDWIDGNTYTSDNNTAMHTIVAGAANGCDSVVTLNLTFGVSATGTDVQHVCDVASYDWIDGNTYTSDNNTATHTIVGGAANGCDSVVTLNLTFGVSATGTDDQTACFEYTWIDGNTYTTSNNTATHTIVGGAANGCDSVVTLNLTINTVDVSVTANDPQITANAVGAAYVWLDCDDNYSVITGETGQMFTASANGNYAVSVTENGCTDTSACTPITTVGIEDFDMFGEVAVYPNPTNGLVNIDLGTFTGASVQVIDLNGKVVYTANNASGLFTFELNQAPGIYMVEVRIENNSRRFKVIKE